MIAPEIREAVLALHHKGNGLRKIASDRGSASCGARQSEGRALGLYQRRRPAETVLYQLVQEHLETSSPWRTIRQGRGCPGTWNGISESTSIAESWPEVLLVRDARTAARTT